MKSFIHKFSIDELHAFSDDDFKNLRAPVGTKNRVNIEIRESSYWANCLRVYLMNSSFYRLVCSEDDIITDDMYLFSNEVKEQIMSIPLFYYEFNHLLKKNFPLKIKNDKIKYKVIDSSVFQESDIGPYIQHNIPLFNLRPNKSLEIKTIRLEKRSAKEDARYKMITGFTYKMNNQTVELSYECPYQVCPRENMLMPLKYALENMKSELTSIKNSLRVENGYFKADCEEERLGILICMELLKKDTSLKIANSFKEHSDDDVIVINVDSDKEDVQRCCSEIIERVDETIKFISINIT